MSALAVNKDAELPIAQAGLGAAAERYARLTLRKSEQTQATYLSTYRRFAEWLSHQTGHPDPPPATLTADAVAAYISELETRKAAATVRGACGDQPAGEVPAHTWCDRRDRDPDDRRIQSSRATPPSRRAGCRHLETRQGRRARGYIKAREDAPRELSRLATWR